MIYISQSTQVLNLQISANSNVAVAAAWAEINDAGLTANAAASVIANTNSAIIVGGPLSLTSQRQVSFLSVVNTDSANTQLVQLSMSNGTTSANLIPAAKLLPGWGLYYLDAQGFQIMDASSGIVPDVFGAIT